MGISSSDFTMKAAVVVVAVAVTLAVGNAVERKPYHSNKELKTGVATATQNQYLDCWDFGQNQGDQLRAIDYIQALRQYNFDNRISYCRATSIWLLYQDENFNAGNPGASDMWVYGDQYNIQMPSGFDNQASSLRFTGAKDDWRANTLNFYLNDYFIGGEEYTYGDIAQVNYNDQAKSIVVTGCSGWTLYEGANYSGLCKCVWPVSTSQCTPGFYKTSTDLGNMAGRISSARHGCFCGSSLKPNNHAVSNVRGSQRAGNSQFYDARDSA